MEIKLDSPKTLTLQPGTIAYILDVLAEQPFKKSSGPISEIVSQIQARPEVPLTEKELMRIASGMGNGKNSEHDPIG